MNAGHARSVACEWVSSHASVLTGFRGAYLAGSINTLSNEAPLPTTSDVDVMIVLDVPDLPDKPGKTLYQEVLLDITYLSLGQVQMPEQVLGHYHLAASFQTAAILADPGGRLSRHQVVVAEGFARRSWVERRCEQARDVVLTRLDQAIVSPSFEEQVMSWLFAAGGLPHILLVAGLENPTVRRRYEAAGNLLKEYGHGSLAVELVDVLDPDRMPPSRVTQHLSALESLFDTASSVISTPFVFASDISRNARPVAIDGSREMVAQGHHREALFWIIATFARCQMVVHNDAPPDLSSRWDDGFRRLLGDLGIQSGTDLHDRCRTVRDAMPQVWNTGVEIMDANPEVRRD